MTEMHLTTELLEFAKAAFGIGTVVVILGATYLAWKRVLYPIVQDYKGRAEAAERRSELELGAIENVAADLRASTQANQATAEANRVTAQLLSGVVGQMQPLVSRLERMNEMNRS